MTIVTEFCGGITILEGKFKLLDTVKDKYEEVAFRKLQNFPPCVVAVVELNKVILVK